MHMPSRLLSGIDSRPARPVLRKPVARHVPGQTRHARRPPRTLTHADITNCEFAVVTPVSVESWVFIMSWDPGQIIQHGFDLNLADALDEGLERFILLALAHVATGESLHNLGDPLGGDGSHRQSIRTRVVSPFAAQHNLEVRYRVIARMAANPIETKISDVMLSTGVEAAA